MKGTENKQGQAGQDLLEELFRHVEAREQPPHDDEQAIRASLHEQWAEMTRYRRRRRRRLYLAAAASLAVAVIAGSILFRSPVPATPTKEVASVELLKGSVVVQDLGSEVVFNLAMLDPLKTSQRVSTPHGAGLAALWQNGIALRVDQNSRFLIVSPSEIELHSGRVYIDTDKAAMSEAPLTLSTPAGLVRHVGTRYMVAVNLGSTSVSVREGQVLLGDNGAAASGGEKLVVSSSGELRRESISVFGDTWQWTEVLAAPFAADGRTVSELLDWVGHESGRNVEYASPAAQRLADETHLHGDIALEPMKALSLLTQTTDLETDVRAGTIVVSTAPAR